MSQYNKKFKKVSLELEELYERTKTVAGVKMRQVKFVGCTRKEWVAEKDIHDLVVESNENTL